MPIFEYQCEKCGVFDVLQLSGDKPLRFCPTCAKKKKKTKVVKIVSSPAFHLKGTGWYKTDYASPSTKEANSKVAEGVAGSKSDGKNEVSETKSEKEITAKESSGTETSTPEKNAKEASSTEKGKKKDSAKNGKKSV